jgi:hypothetical protein
MSGHSCRKTGGGKGIKGGKEWEREKKTPVCRELNPLTLGPYTNALTK